MKTLTILFALIATAMAVPAASSSPASAPRHYVIAIGAGLPANQGDELFKQSLDLLLNRAQPGDRVEFLAAPQGNLLAAVVVPPGTARARASSREYAAKFGTLKQFLTKPATFESRMATQLRLPQLLDEIARARRPQEDLTLIVIGSPLYLASNEREAAFDMEKGLTPSDGMIVASVNESIFGTQERKAQLQNSTIHWLTPNDDWAVGEMHRRAVTRFWTLFANEEGAMLSSFSSDTARVFDRALQGGTGTMMNVTLDPNDRGLVMRPPPIFRRETAPSVESGINVPPARTLSHATALATNSPVPVISPVPKPGVASAAIAKAVAEIPRTPPGRLGIAAIWEAPAHAAATADVDLYVAAHPGAPEVFWKRAEATDAVYYRDIRHAGPQGSSSDWTASWEYVEVRHERLQDVSLWLNLFETKAPVKGIVRIQCCGQTVDKPFSFTASRGNQGADSTLAQRRQSSYWQEVRLSDLFAGDSATREPNR